MMNNDILLFYWLRLVCEDISGGQEDVPIPATNLVDDPPVAPTGKLLTLGIIVIVNKFWKKKFYES